MRKLLLSILFLFPVFIVQAQSVPASSYDADVPNDYFQFSLKLTKESAGHAPPIAARNFGYMGLTLFESLVSGLPGYTSLEGQIPGLTGVPDANSSLSYHWPTVANHALCFITDSLFANASQVNRDSLHAIRDRFDSLFVPSLSPSVYSDSKNLGLDVANAIWLFSKTDGGYQAYLYNFPAYSRPVGPAYWAPFGNQQALLPYWGNNRPFSLADTTSSITQGPPVVFDSVPGSQFYNYANQVYTTVNSLSIPQINIATYWADGGGTLTPPGHSISMLRSILVQENSDLGFSSVAYAKMGLSLSDAFLACWRTKYIYNLLRPVTYIRNYIDSTWLPFISTPPFPECNSGHSSQSGAMAEVMENLFGLNYAFTDSTHGMQFGGPRTFPDFDSCAKEAAVSRLYGGIHYEFSDNGGLSMGRLVAVNILALFPALVSEEKEKVQSLSLFPNPASDRVSISSEGVPVLRLRFYDARGRLCLESDSNEDLNISSLIPGIYFAEIMTSQGAVTRRLSIVR